MSKKVYELMKKNKKIFKISLNIIVGQKLINIIIQ